MYREHPVTIVRYCKKYIWLLIIPIIRAITNFRHLQFTADTFKSWIKWSFFDGIVFLIIIAAGFTKWYFTFFSYDNKTIKREYRFLFNSRCSITEKSIVSVIAEKVFYLRPIKVVKVYFDTTSGNISDSDIALVISYKDYEKMKQTLKIFERTKNIPPMEKPKIFDVVLFSLFFSSSLSGTVYVAAVLLQGRKNILDIINELQVQQKLNEISFSISSKLKIVPPAIIALLTVLIFLWFISFVSNCIRYLKFKIIKRERYIEIDYGLITKRYYYIDSSRINYTDLRQNILMKFKPIDMYSITASCPGYGNRSTQIPVFVPSMRKEKLKKMLEMLMPDQTIIRNRYRAEVKSFWQFLWQPCITGLVILLVCIAASIIFSMFRQITPFILFMCEVPVILMIFVRIYDIFFNGVGIKNGQITIRYTKGFIFHTILADCSKIVKIHTTQSWFQKKAGICHMYFYFESRNSKKHKVIALRYEDALKIERIITKAKGNKDGHNKKAV